MVRLTDEDPPLVIVTGVAAGSDPDSAPKEMDTGLAVTVAFTAALASRRPRRTT